MDRTVIVADDEPLARDRLRHLLGRHAGWSIVAECRNGVEAVDAILAHRPDVAFLDIRMPALDGMEVADALAAGASDQRGTALVFVTAFDQFALRAFDLAATDYLLKPVDAERFARTLQRVTERLATTHAPPGDVATALDQVRGGSSWVTRFVVRSARGYHFVSVSDVEWIGAEGNYAALHAAGRAHLIRHTMKSLEDRLDPSRFVRVHRSAFVDVERVVRAEPLGHGEYRLILSSGARVATSRAYVARVHELLRSQPGQG